MNKTKGPLPLDPCGNEDCDKCDPRPRWKVSAHRIQHLTYTRKIKAASAAEALRIFEEGTAWPTQYDDAYGEIVQQDAPVAAPLPPDEYHLTECCYHDLLTALPKETTPESGSLVGVEGASQEEGRRSIATVSIQEGRAVLVDLGVLSEECARIILERPRDGSPPMVALSADVLYVVATYARTLSRGIAEARSPEEVMLWQKFVAAGPTVSGDGAADAWGSVVHPMHVSMVRRNAEPGAPR